MHVSDVIAVFKQVKSGACNAAATASETPAERGAASAAAEAAAVAGDVAAGECSQELPPVSDVVAAIREIKALKKASRPISSSLLRFLTSCALRAALIVLHVFLYS